MDFFCDGFGAGRLSASGFLRLRVVDAYGLRHAIISQIVIRNLLRFVTCCRAFYWWVASHAADARTQRLGISRLTRWSSDSAD